MIDYLIALATVTLAWWISTGLVLLLNRQGAAVRKYSLIAITGLALLSLAYLPERSTDRSAVGALLGFAQGLVLWAWLEMTYLMGVITGPRKTPCPPDASTGRRFWLGLQTSLYHELSVITLVVAVVVLSSSGPNQVAAATCVCLWLMRWSAKLNLFLGVRNYNSDWFPAALAYLDSYTKRASMNPLFPVSVTAGSVVATILLAQATMTSDPFQRAGNLLVSALLSLAVLEHWFLMYPFGESALWRWALAPAKTPAPPPAKGGEPRDGATASIHPLPLQKRAQGH